MGVPMDFAAFANSVREHLWVLETEPAFRLESDSALFMWRADVAELQLLDHSNLRMSLSSNGALIRTIELPMSASSVKLVADGIIAVFEPEGDSSMFEEPADLFSRVLDSPIALTASYSGPLTLRGWSRTRNGLGSITASVSGIEGQIQSPFDRTVGLAGNLERLLTDDEPLGSNVPADRFGTAEGGSAPTYRARQTRERRLETGGRDVADIFFVGFELEVQYSEAKPVLYRHVFSSAKLPTGSSFSGQYAARRLDIQRVSSFRAPGEEIIVAVHDGEPLAEFEYRALWLSVSFMCGRQVGVFLTESFAEDGSLVTRTFKPRMTPGPTTIEPFSVHPSAYTPEDFVDVFPSGFLTAMNDGFPIDVVLMHLFDAEDRILDLKLQSLVLAIHAAIEAWHKIAPPEPIINDKAWSSLRASLAEAVRPLLDRAPDNIRNAVNNAINGARNTPTKERERRFMSDWNIPASGAMEKYALALRNTLLHNGYFPTRFEDADRKERQQRTSAVQVLKNLVILILCRAVGHCGDIVDQRTFSGTIALVAASRVFPLKERAPTTQEGSLPERQG